ncbi:MAG: SWIM zinc finger family protein [Desulfobacterales bacterium]|jgi:uncharacterized Zn finger protein
MPKKKTQPDRFVDLSWNDFEEWAGSKIVSRGKNYQRQGLVSELAQTDDGSLIAWVEGSERYATRVDMGDDGLPESICTCPYEVDCKHAVAVILEYLKRVDSNKDIPKAIPNDDRLKLLEDEDWDDEPEDDDEYVLPEDMQKDIDGFLKGKTKAQLIELIQEFARRHPKIAQDLVDRRHLSVGNTKALVKNLRQEIRDIADEPGWQNYWQGEGYTPDYSGIRKKLSALLAAGHPDEVLAVGRELVTTGNDHVGMSDDEGETHMEIADCMPVIVEALNRSSLEHADKLIWALDAVLEDQYELCEAFAEYLHRDHPATVWSTVADRLLSRLKSFKPTKGMDEFSRNYERERLSDWTIHALERASRKDEVIPLCEAEAKRTGSYLRLVDRLMAARRYQDAERWILTGIQNTKGKWSGSANRLRDKLMEIRIKERNWSAVAAIQADEFVRYPSRKAFSDCKKTSGRVKAWSDVRESLLRYLEKGILPWKQRGWPLPDSGLDKPEPERKDRYPMADKLIAIAILEKKPDQVLHWYDQILRKGFGWYGVNDDEVAASVQSYAPERAVDIWKNKAERLIAQVKPKAYREAAKYLRKAGLVMERQKKSKQWDEYLQGLRQQHARKIRLMEILDGLKGKPILKKRG